jgi:hypothetical protein
VGSSAARLDRHGGEQEADGCLTALDGTLGVALGEEGSVRYDKVSVQPALPPASSESLFRGDD